LEKKVELEAIYRVVHKNIPILYLTPNFYSKRYFQFFFTKLFDIGGKFIPPNFFEIDQVFLCKILIIYDVFNPGDRLTSRRTDFPWPPYSPDLNPPDYFLWGYLKEKVYANNPQTLAELKENIRREIRNIPRDMIARVIANFNVRVANVIQQM
jgi:hypothetical protein